MNGYELRDTVCALGFTSEMPDESSFYHAANLALSRLRTLIPLRRTVKLCPLMQKPSAFRDRGESFKLHSSSGISYYFEYIGSVTLTVTHGGKFFNERLVNESSKYAVISRDFDACAPLTVEFSGEGLHLIANACIYDRLSLAGGAEAYCDHYSYDMRSEDGFLSVLSVDGGEYSLHGSEIRFPLDSDGEYSVEYSYRPLPLSEDNMSDELGIDPSLSEAAALLTAYYVWMDDDAGKAENYRDEYDIAVRDIMKRRQVDVSRISGNGW